jgi:hypothetical protein
MANNNGGMGSRRCNAFDVKNEERRMKMRAMETMGNIGRSSEVLQAQEGVARIALARNEDPELYSSNHGDIIGTV